MNIYLCSEALAKQIKVKKDSNLFGHKTRTTEQKNFLWPEHFHKRSLSLQAFLKHKTMQGIEKLIIIDRIKNSEGIKKINGHINRSGNSFLVAETPFKGRPTFPDMSKIYGEKPGETVTTVGPERFATNGTQKENTISEALAPIASLWHYLGVSIRAYGCGNNILSPTQLIEGINEVD